MNYKKFFEQAKDAGIEVAAITYRKSSKLGFSLFHKEIDNYSISSQSSVSASGIYNNQLGVVRTEQVGDDQIPFLVDSIKVSASTLEKVEKPVIFKGSEKYNKKNTFNANLPKVSVDEKLAKLYELEEYAYKADSRVTEVQVEYEEEDETNELANSYGLNLKSRGNYFVYQISVVCKQGDEIKSDWDVFLDNDFSKFNPKEVAEKLVKNVTSKFNGQPIKAGAYKCVLNPGTVASFLSAVINTGFDADNVFKKSSILVGKLDTKVFSSKVTVEEKPLLKNVFFRYFDDEGVATYNKKLIDKGVVKTYLYNLEAAGRENKESTGNGFNGGISARNLVLKPGKLQEDELFAKIGNGVYITSISGLHSGMNPQSGDFSLEAQGFKVENGKKGAPLTLITVGGNIYKLFDDVLAIGNNSELRLNEVTAPSIAIKSLKISSL